MDLSRSAPRACNWFFFFQAEDGIRDYKVTGVQTCALPIFLQEGARQRDALPLAARQLHAPLADLGFIALRETLDELVCVGGLGSRDNLLARGAGRGVGDVLRDARGEEHRLLEHECELSPPVVEPVLAQF